MSGLDPQGLTPNESYWHHTVTHEERLPAVSADCEFDLMIVGGGYTGLSCAREFSDAFPQMRIGLFERDFVGFGASGRNTGYANAGVGHSLPDELLSRFGENNARSTVQLGHAAVDHLLRTIREFDIDCDLQLNGMAFVASDSAQLSRVKAIDAAARFLGQPGELWDEATARERLGTPHVLGAFYDAHAANLNPFKLARGLLEKILLPRAPQVTVFESSPLTELRFHQDHVTAVACGQHNVRARYVILATNAYAAHLDTPAEPHRYARFAAPLHVYSVITEPLTVEQRQQLGGFGTRPIGWYSLHHILWAVRLTPDHRLAIATGDVKYHSNDRLHVASPRTTALLTDALAVWLPQLEARSLRPAHAWEGVVSMPLSDRPCFGSHSAARPHVLHAMAYCGHGVPLSNYAGVLLRDLFLELNPLTFTGNALPSSSLSPSPFRTLDWFTPAQFPFPPVPRGPVRSLIATVYLGSLKWLDRLHNYRRALPLDRPDSFFSLFAKPLAVVAVLSSFLYVRLKR